MIQSSDSKRRILFFLPNFSAGGAERVLLTLMNGVDRDIFDPVLLVIRGNGALRSLVNPEIPLIDLDCPSVVRSVPSIFKALCMQRPSIVVSTMAPMNFIMLALKPFFPRIKFVVREAALPSMIFTSRKKWAYLIKLAYHVLYPWAARVIIPSSQIQNEFVSKIGLQLKDQELLFNPVDVKKIRFMAATEQSWETPACVHFVVSGTLYWPKGIDRLLMALPEIKMTVPWHLTILGDGPDRSMLESIVQKNNLTDRVTFLGYSDNPWAYYAAADCFLLCSRSEGMPNVLLESLACGTPAIAMTEAGGASDVAAIAAPGSVTMVSTITEFIRAMEKIRPAPPHGVRPSLLPDAFEKNAVIKRFSAILISL